MPWSRMRATSRCLPVGRKSGLCEGLSTHSGEHAQAWRMPWSGMCAPVRLVRMIACVHAPAAHSMHVYIAASTKAFWEQVGAMELLCSLCEAVTGLAARRHMILGGGRRRWHCSSRPSLVRGPRAKRHCSPSLCPPQLSRDHARLRNRQAVALTATSHLLVWATATPCASGCAHMLLRCLLHCRCLHLWGHVQPES